MTQRERSREIALWFVTAMLAGVFIFTGLIKLAPTYALPTWFAAWQLPMWLLWIIGFAEIVGAAMLLYPTTATAGAVLLAGPLGGSLIAEMVSGQWAAMRFSLCAIVGLMVIAWARRDELGTEGGTVGATDTW